MGSVHKGICSSFMEIASSMLVSPTIKQENAGFGNSLAINESRCAYLLILVLWVTEKDADVHTCLSAICLQ